jgi:hypothetical protein
MAVKRKVTVPEGRSGLGSVQRELDRLLQRHHAAFGPRAVEGGVISQCGAHSSDILVELRSLVGWPRHADLLA